MRSLMRFFREVGPAEMGILWSVGAILATVRARMSRGVAAVAALLLIGASVGYWAHHPELARNQPSSTHEKAGERMRDEMPMASAPREVPRGVQYSRAERAAWAFGAETESIDTDHFVIFGRWTRVLREIGMQLEAMNDRLADLLGASLTDDTLDVYVFWSRSDFAHLCKRAGVPHTHATDVEGIATGSYIAFAIEARERDMMHELTHAVFRRKVGSEGGSWLQEGFAVFAGACWEGASPARLFRPSAHTAVPLREFMQMDTFLGDDRKRTEARYSQAGAFIEFVVRGPYRHRAADIVRTVASTPASGFDRLKRVEAAFGTRLEDLEMRWQAWAADPTESD